MTKYVTKIINIEELLLDEKNPRFIIPPNPSQQSIVDYLIDYEEVEQLAIDIGNSGGLYAGERVIAIKEKEKYIVLEGNRRVCACKILLNPSLLSHRRPASINKISLLSNENLRNSISSISVDIMPDRTSAQSSLAAKHIDGIKKWSTISKYKFFALEFDSGRSLDEIALVTGVSPAKIKNGLKEYRIIEYVLGLSFWTNTDREEYLNLQQLKTSRLTRLFSAKTKNNIRLRELLDLGYDDQYKIKTSLNKDTFDKILHIVAQAAFNPDYCSEFNGTRSTYEDIPQLMQFLRDKKIIVEENDHKTRKPESQEAEDTSQSASDDNRTDGKERNKKKEKKGTSSHYTSNRNVLIPDDFYVSCKIVKINNIVNELKKLNLNNYVNAPAVLLRVLIELSLKYYLNKTGESKRIVENNLDGTFNAALEIMRLKKIISKAEHSSLNQLRKNEKIFNIFNGYVHYDSVLPSKDILIYFFDNVRKVIEICLNS